jgi:hypothetical protein
MILFDLEKTVIQKVQKQKQPETIPAFVTRCRQYESCNCTGKGLDIKGVLYKLLR